jgi:Tfp pilus assembly protein PilF
MSWTDTRAAPAFAACSIALCAVFGCTQPTPAPVSEGPTSDVQSAARRALAQGLTQYDSGNFKLAAVTLEDALHAGLAPSDALVAHKHLAFIYCITNREQLCRDAFRHALTLDRGFDLTRAEADHPKWGPVFRSLKAAQEAQR